MSADPDLMEVDDLLGSGTEEAIYKTAFSQGFDEGSQEGAGEGWVVGLKTGASIGFELGRYKGFALAVRGSLSPREGEEVTSPGGNLQGGIGGASPSSTSSPQQEGKTLRLCDRIIKAVDEFDFDNVTSVHDACSQVRSQFNLLKASLGIAGEGAGDKQSTAGQKYSF